MKIALIGATGYVGTAILDEALNRGHEVMAVTRNPEKIANQTNLSIEKGDIYNERELSQLIEGADVVISAFNGFYKDQSNVQSYQKQLQGTRSIINAVKLSQVNRLLMVGGAGSLEVAPGVLLVSTPNFPAEWKDMALSMTEVLSILKDESSLNWTLLSPAAKLLPGSRTGRFRLGKDELLINEAGESIISIQDYAVAMIDEMEQAEHLRMRFTVAY